LAVAVTPFDRSTATSAKGCALVLLRRTEEGAKLLEEDSRRCALGHFYRLAANDPMLGVCKVLQGNIGVGIRLIKEAISRREKDGYRGVADWNRLLLGEVYLQIINGNEKLPLPTLLKNLPAILKVMATGSSRIRALTTRVLENPHFDPAGYFVGRAQMILGLLYKAKKKRTLAVQHLTEAKRISSQFGQTPMLARVEAALAELG
jgi:hypothetical protein